MASLPDQDQRFYGFTKEAIQKLVAEVQKLKQFRLSLTGTGLGGRPHERAAIYGVLSELLEVNSKAKLKVYHENEETGEQEENEEEYEVYDVGFMDGNQPEGTLLMCVWSDGRWIALAAGQETMWGQTHSHVRIQDGEGGWYCRYLFVEMQKVHKGAGLLIPKLNARTVWAYEINGSGAAVGLVYPYNALLYRWPKSDLSLDHDDGWVCDFRIPNQHATGREYVIE